MKTGLRAFSLGLLALWMGCADFDQAEQSFCERNPARCGQQPGDGGSLPYSQIAFSTAPQTVQVGSCSSVTTVQLWDTHDAPVNVTTDTAVVLTATPSEGFEFFTDASCTGASVTKVIIHANSSSASFYFKGAHEGPATLSASVDDISGTLDVTISPISGPGNRLVFTSAAQTVVAGTCSQPAQIQSQDEQGNAFTVSVTTTISLSASPSEGFKFYADANCTTVVTSIDLTAGASSTKVFFKGSNAVSVSITATASTFSGSTQAEKIIAGPPSTIVVTGPTPTGVDDCSSAVTVSLEDTWGNATTATANTIIDLTVSGKAMSLSNDNVCASTITSVSIPSGASTARLYYRGTQAGTFTIKGENGGLKPGTLSVTFTAGPPSTLVFTTLPPSTQAGNCSPTVNVQFQDDFGNPSKVVADTTVHLSAAPSTGFQFFQNAGCTGSVVTEITMLAGSSDASFSFIGTHSGTVTLTASVGAILTTQNATINPGSPTTLAFSPVSLTVKAGDCTQATVQVKDTYGNLSPVTASKTVSLVANPSTGFAFFSTSGCTIGVTAATIPTAQSSVAFYMRVTNAGSFVVTATSTSLTNAALPVTVN